MTVRNTHERWGTVSQLLHWLIVVLIAAQAALGLTGIMLPLGVGKLAVLATHKSMGVTILGLAALRLLWRWMNPTPPLPSNLKPYERILAHFTHKGLYVLLFAMPLTGWMMTSARGFPASWFNVFQLPDFVPKSESLYDAMVVTHATLASCLAVIVALHIAGALKHHFVLKDDTLRRMLPFSRMPLALFAALLLAVPPAHAAGGGPVYRVVPAQSSVTYTFIQAGAANQGRFKSFVVRFDPAAGELHVVIDMRSFDTGDQQRNDLLGGKDFFDVAQYGNARFTAAHLERSATGYLATGSLTLRGVTRNVAIPFTWRTATAQGRTLGYLAGEITLQRLDFGIGQGQWKFTEWVGNDVTVHYQLVLAPLVQASSASK
ncbi:MAG TPA: YceI family protein [Steroidobacteraceae bacterium]|nr:YceI family protein [Steroidobacteraceae bacterium]